VPNPLCPSARTRHATRDGIFLSAPPSWRLCLFPLGTNSLFMIPIVCYFLRLVHPATPLALTPSLVAHLCHLRPSPKRLKTPFELLFNVVLIPGGGMSPFSSFPSVEFSQSVRFFLSLSANSWAAPRNPPSVMSRPFNSPISSCRDSIRQLLILEKAR
jgi:hypothetical protein